MQLTGQGTERSVILNEGWEFVKGDLGGVWEALRDEKLSALPAWTEVKVPHSFNALDAVNPDVPYYQGPGWYRFYIDSELIEEDKRSLLYFEGAGQKTKVWIYDQLVGSHIGGYDEFTIDITDAVQDFLSQKELTASFRNMIPLVVRVDNSRDLEMIPSDLSDFNLYGGLYRKVSLIRVPGISLERVQISSKTDVKNKKAEISIKTELYNPDTIKQVVSLKYTISDPDLKNIASGTIEKLVSKAEEIEIKVDLKKITLWDVKNPALYSLELQLTGSEGTDIIKEKFGLRDFEFVPHGPFFLNGERIFLRGTHRHEDHAGYAQAMPEKLVRQEMEMMKEMGVNFIRLGHYQQDKFVLELCDELGIMVWEEIPWCRGGLGNDSYKDQAKRMLTNMIEQHYNHPSVIIWGMGNENDWPGDFKSFEKDSIRAFMKELNDLSHLLDPSRKTAIRRCEFCADIIDVYSPSIWAGWYSGKYTEYMDVSKMWNEKVDHFLHVEWGASMHTGRHSEDPYKDLSLIMIGGGTDEKAGDFLLEGGRPRASKDGDWSETYGCDLIDWHLKEQEKMDWHTGTAYWPFKDFSTPLRPDNAIPYVNQKGIVQRDLRKKEAFYIFQSYWTEEPMIHIYGNTWPVRWGEPGEKKLVRVYSNCTEAELFVNGVSAGTKIRNSQNFPAAGLSWNVPFKSGTNTISVVGKSGKETVKDEISFEYQDKKWGEPDHIELTELSVEEGVMTVQAVLLDKDNLICLDNKNFIRFELAGDGELIEDQGTYDGSSKVQLANGRAFARIKLKKGQSVLSAKISGIPVAFINAKEETE
ncbi:MAG: glycoside hydrolase family 2 protein [Bacteroidales bacterium]|nr:glycoside hydrolase family 2 protein [Bacteroidales bacterium]MCF8392115.1 glycoside hydrolase family 2 protein [Bacteroidales bacterium]